MQSKPCLSTCLVSSCSYESHRLPRSERLRQKMVGPHGCVSRSVGPHVFQCALHPTNTLGRRFSSTNRLSVVHFHDCFREGNDSLKAMRGDSLQSDRTDRGGRSASLSQVMHFLALVMCRLRREQTAGDGDRGADLT